MLALLAKELRALRPVILFLICYEFFGLCTVLWMEFPDRLTFEEQLTRESGATDIAASLVIITLVVCAGLLTRERDEGTLSFLDGLPVSRTRLFAGKLLAALVVLGSVVVFEVGYGVTVHLLSRDSLEKSFPWALLGTLLGVHALIALSLAGLALALSFLRRWMFLTLALLVWAFIFGRQAHMPHLDLFDPFVLATPVLREGRWLVPWPNVFAQLGVAIVGLGIALAGFRALGDGAGLASRRLSRPLLIRVAAVVGTALIPVTWFGIFAWIGHDAQEREADEWNPAAADPAETINTESYAVIFRQSQREPARELADRADDLQRQVAEFLGSAPLQITVDTTSRLARHNAGQAFWRKIRMTLQADDAEEDAAVLAHETAHVHLDQISDYRLAAVFPSVRFFHEGLASFIEHRLCRTGEELRRFRRAGVVAHAWQPVAFEKLCDDEAFRRERNPNLVYPLGEIFCAAIVRRHGDAALGKIARAFARPDAPKGLKHLELWQDTLQACGYSLEGVLAEFRRLLDVLVAEERPLIDSLPRPTATVEFTGAEIIIRPSVTPPPDALLYCVARPEAGAADYEFEHPELAADGSFHLSRAYFSYGTFWYQLGWLVRGARQPLLDRWVEVAITR